MGWREWTKLAAMALYAGVAAYQTEILKLISDGVITPTAQFRMNMAIVAGLAASLYAVMTVLDQTVANALGQIKSAVTGSPAPISKSIS